MAVPCTPALSLNIHDNISHSVTLKQDAAAAKTTSGTTTTSTTTKTTTTTTDYCNECQPKPPLPRLITGEQARRRFYETVIHFTAPSA